MIIINQSQSKEKMKSRTLNQLVILIAVQVLFSIIEQSNAHDSHDVGAPLPVGIFPMGVTRDSVPSAVAEVLSKPTPGELAGAMPVRMPALGEQQLQQPQPVETRAAPIPIPAPAQMPPPAATPIPGAQMGPPPQAAGVQMAPETLEPKPDELGHPQPKLQRSQSDSILTRFLSGKDRRPLDNTCDGIYEEVRRHGYELLEYKFTTADNYEIKIHRLTRPMAPKTPGQHMKKPYLLLHGLLGSSTSFVRNIDPSYQAPVGPDFDYWASVEKTLKGQHAGHKTHWRSTADQFRQSFPGDLSQSAESMTTYQKLLSHVHRPQEKLFASVENVDFWADTLNFGQEFRQAHNKYELPKEAKPYLSNSLAYTLANFGYDVWLLNLRGSHFSRNYNGRYSTRNAEYWDFSVEQIVNDDLLASINFVKGNTGWKDPVGFVSYSYSAMHVLNLLTKHPQYQEFLQPVVLMAPAVLTNSWHNIQLKVALELITKALVPHNGPFPNLGRSKSDLIERMACSMLIAKKLCTAPEMLLHGRLNGVKDLMFDDKQAQMISSDIKCGQTSGALVRRIVKGFGQSLGNEFQPSKKTLNKLLHGSGVRRTVMLIHSEDDQIATMSAIQKVKESALKLLVLNDVVIKEPRFDHTDFLFSKRNEYLVNAEIARYASVFDFMMYQNFANKVLELKVKSID